MMENIDNALRMEMVQKQIMGRGISDPAVLHAMRTVPRHLFVPEDIRASSYADHPLPIGYGQTISQPFIVAFMTEAAGLRAGDRVLEIGTGSGYQAAVLAEVVREVYTVESVFPLAENVRERLKNLGYNNIFVQHSDGYGGWPEKAPFDAILVTAAAPEIPQNLLQQLKVGGRMVIPVGSSEQELYRLTSTAVKVKEERLLPVRFVPMVGKSKKIN